MTLSELIQKALEIRQEHGNLVVRNEEGARVYGLEEMILSGGKAAVISFEG